MAAAKTGLGCFPNPPGRIPQHGLATRPGWSLGDRFASPEKGTKTFLVRTKAPNRDVSRKGNEASVTRWLPDLRRQGLRHGEREATGRPAVPVDVFGDQAQSPKACTLSGRRYFGCRRLVELQEIPGGKHSSERDPLRRRRASQNVIRPPRRDVEQVLLKTAEGC